MKTARTIAMRTPPDALAGLLNHAFARVVQRALTRCAAVLLAVSCMTLPAAQSAAQATTPTGSLIGTVFTDTGDVPIANAEITFPALKLSARSDNRGNFQITGVPAGAQTLIVRSVGYDSYEATMTFRTGEKVEADFMLKATVTKLAKVNVKAAADPRYAVRLADFDKRRREGTGRFLTAETFEKAEGRNISDVLIGAIPGVRTVTSKDGKLILVSRRGLDCYLQVIVNGMTRYNGKFGEEAFDVNNVITGQIIGVEYYTVAETPSQFNATSGREGKGGSHCGTVVFWTK